MACKLGRNPPGSHNHNYGVKEKITELKKMYASSVVLAETLMLPCRIQCHLKFLHFECLTRSLKWIFFPSAYCVGHNWKWNQSRLKLWACDCCTCPVPSASSSISSNILMSLCMQTEICTQFRLIRLISTNFSLTTTDRWPMLRPHLDVLVRR